MQQSCVMYSEFKNQEQSSKDSATPNLPQDRPDGNVHQLYLFKSRTKLVHIFTMYPSVLFLAVARVNN